MLKKVASPQPPPKEGEKGKGKFEMLKKCVWSSLSPTLSQGEGARKEKSKSSTRKRLNKKHCSQTSPRLRREDRRGAVCVLLTKDAPQGGVPCGRGEETSRFL